VPVEVAPAGTDNVIVALHGPAAVVEKRPVVEFDVTVTASDPLGAWDSCNEMEPEAVPAVIICGEPPNVSPGWATHR